MFSRLLPFVFEIAFFVETRKYLISILVDFYYPLTLRILFKVENVGKLRILVVVKNLLTLVDTVLEFVELDENHAIIGEENRKFSRGYKVHFALFGNGLVHSSAIAG